MTIKHFFGVFLSTTLFLLPQFAFAALTTNLVAYWKFDESSGNAADATGNGHTFTNTGTVVYAAGILNNAQFPNGSAQYMNIANGSMGALKITGDMTVMAWVKITSFDFVNTVLFESGSPNASSRAWSAVLRSNLTIFAMSSDGSNEFDTNKATTINTGTWYQLIWVYTAATGHVDFYSNASNYGTGTGYFNSIFSPTTAGLNTGADLDNSTSYLHGGMDESAIWSRALSSSEITQLYNSGTPLAYPFTTSTPFVPPFAMIWWE